MIRIFVILALLSSAALGQQNFGWDPVRGPIEADKLARITGPLFGFQVRNLTNIARDDNRTVLLYRYYGESGANTEAWDQKDFGSCFRWDTMITMRDGSQKHIKDVLLGEEVLTAEGSFGEVVSLFKKEFDGEWVNFKLHGHYGLIVTGDHEVLTERGYIPASQLTDGDRVAMTRRDSSGSTIIISAQHLPEKKYAKRLTGIRGKDITSQVPGKNIQTRTAYTSIPDTFDKTPELGFVLGTFLAEGSTSSGKAVWTWHINEKLTHVARLVDCLNFIGFNSSVREMPHKNTIRVSVYSSDFARLLESLCGKGAASKHPHGDVLSGPAEYLKQVYGGWAAGDGHTRRGRTEVTTVSERLAHSMVGLALSIGYDASISRQACSPGRGIKARQPYRYMVGCPASGKSVKVKNSGALMFRKVREVHKFNKHDIVYNIEVRGDHSYVADNIGVHNCVGFGFARAITESYAVEVFLQKDGDSWIAPFSPDAAYAMSRQKAGQLGTFQGSTGAWAADAIREWGTLLQQEYDEADLSIYDTSRLLEWQKNGMPSSLIDKAKPHPVRATTRVESTGQAKALLQNGYAICTCSMESYGQAKRDDYGFARNDGKNGWAHAMEVSGYRGPDTGREGFLIINSWSPKFGSGPKWPDDQPDGSFWVSVDSFREHIASKDTWAVGSIDGFRKRNLKLREAIAVGGTDYAMAP